MQKIKCYLFLQFNKPLFQIAMGIISVFAFLELLGNIILYRGSDITGMYQMVRMLLLSSDSAMGTVFVFLFPIIAVLPAGFSYLDDVVSGMDRYLIAKTGGRGYHDCRLVAGGIAGFVAVFIPLTLELVIGGLAFPLEATGNFMNVSATQQTYIDEVKSYLLYSLYLKNSVLYYFLAVCSISMIASMLNVFTISLSMMIRVKYRMLLVVPSYVFFLITRFDVYLRVFGYHYRNMFVYLTLILILLLITVYMSVWSREYNDK